LIVGTEMKMSDFDRIMAMERCPVYIKDREALLKLFRKEINGPVSKKAKVLYNKLCRKWNIEGLYLRDDESGGLHFKIDECEPIKLIADDEWFQIQRTANNNYGNHPLPRIPCCVTVKNRLYVQLQIDLDRSQEGLEKYFGYIIRKWKKHTPKENTKERYRGRGYSPWDVYKLHHEDRLNFSEIARKLSGRKGYASGNRYLMAEYKRVKRAYEKACKMICQVSKGIKSTSHLSFQ